MLGLSPLHILILSIAYDDDDLLESSIMGVMLALFCWRLILPKLRDSKLSNYTTTHHIDTILPDR